MQLRHDDDMSILIIDITHIHFQIIFQNIQNRPETTFETREIFDLMWTAFVIRLILPMPMDLSSVKSTKLF